MSTIMYRPRSRTTNLGPHPLHDPPTRHRLSDSPPVLAPCVPYFPSLVCLNLGRNLLISESECALGNSYICFLKALSCLLLVTVYLSDYTCWVQPQYKKISRPQMSTLPLSYRIFGWWGLYGDKTSSLMHMGSESKSESVERGLPVLAGRSRAGRLLTAEFTHLQPVYQSTEASAVLCRATCQPPW
ncbi:hypothetical protein EDB83DRAFT_109443 [Lactarius deliciosus]|nr:hypothetical protein EDB83DRAFT_109443 [Lactarius deliciosus]